MASPPSPHQLSSSLASSSTSSSSSSTMPPPLLLLPLSLSYWSQAAAGGQYSVITGSSSSTVNWKEDDWEMAPRVVPHKARASRQTNSTSNKRRAMFPFRTAPMTSVRRGRVVQTSTASGRGTPCHARCRHRLHDLIGRQE